MVKKKALYTLICIGLFLIVLPTLALAQEESKIVEGGVNFFVACVITAGFSLGIAAGMGSLGQARAIFAACEGIARQPNASGKLTTTLVIGLAFIESLSIYVLVIGLIIFFANPWWQYFIR
ncbi:ATP synthase F0 subunit C [candidate division CSSED10-310 bacterium]|uniref:ATP synthase subunit c n=1 Tax=candidate division CSSED10-310 bacterium TaxID=2855610 RepID=A0ABV6YVE7_UNCC1